MEDQTIPTAPADAPPQSASGVSMGLSSFPPPEPRSRIRIIISQLAGFYATNKIYVWAVGIGVLLIAGMAALLLRPSGQSPADVQSTVSIEAPETVSSGGEAIYKVKIENKDVAELRSISLELVFPQQVQYISSSPKADNLSGTLYKIPDLAQGQNAVVILKTKVLGDVNSELGLLARVSFSYQNFNSEFTKEARATTRIVASDIDLRLSGPTTTNNTQLVQYEIKYANNSDKPIEQARISLDYPEHFNFGQSQPQPTLNNAIWEINTLAAGQSGSITVAGNFRGARPGESKILSAELLIPDGNGNFLTQASASFITGIGDTPLLVSQRIESENIQIVDPGQTVRVVIDYQNNAAVAARNAVIVATVESAAVDYGSIRAEGAQVSNNTITWNAASVQQLESLNPSEKGSVAYSFKVRSPASRDAKNLSITTSIKIKAEEYTNFLSGEDVVLKISSPSSLEASVSYVSGEQSPRVGSSTTYQITLSIRNSGNEYADALLTAFMPLSSGSFNKDSVTAKELSNFNFDPSSGKITWKVGQVAPYSGSLVPARKVSFTVTLTPSASQVGQSPTLIKTIQATAKDMFTEQNISLQADDITIRDAAGNNYSAGQVQQ